MVSHSIEMISMANEIVTVTVMIAGTVGTAITAGAATMIIQIGVDRSTFDRRH
jgi:hypothetical protein